MSKLDYEYKMIGNVSCRRTIWKHYDPGRWEMVTEKREGWSSDVSNHPDSSLTGPGYKRSQNPDHLVCPYCGDTEYDLCELSTEEGSYWCDECEKEYLYESSFGYGLSTKAMPCDKLGKPHRFVFCSQYIYDGKNNAFSSSNDVHSTRILECIHCEKMDYLKGNQTLLPWLEEYNNPSYFDPDSTLTSDDTFIAKSTPVLDFLSRVRNWKYVGSKEVDRAIDQHNAIYCKESK